MSHRRLFLDLERRKPSSRIRGHFRLPVYRKVHDLVNRLLELPRPPPSPSPVSRNTWWTGPRGRECTVSSRCNRQKKKKKESSRDQSGCVCSLPAVRHDFQFPGHPYGNPIVTSPHPRVKNLWEIVPSFANERGGIDNYATLRISVKIYGDFDFIY